MANQAEIDEFWKSHYQQRLALMEAEIASLKAFIQLVFNRPGDGAILRAKSANAEQFKQARLIYDDLFPPEGIAKRAGRDPLRQHSTTPKRLDAAIDNYANRG